MCTESEDHLPTESEYQLSTWYEDHLPTESEDHLSTESEDHLSTESEDHLLTESIIQSLTKVKMVFVHLLCYLIRPCPSTTHRSDDLFINAAIMKLATFKIDIRSNSRALARKSVSVLAAKCDVTTALVRQNNVTKS